MTHPKGGQTRSGLAQSRKMIKTVELSSVSGGGGKLVKIVELSSLEGNERAIGPWRNQN